MSHLAAGLCAIALLFVGWRVWSQLSFLEGERRRFRGLVLNSDLLELAWDGKSDALEISPHGSVQRLLGYSPEEAQILTLANLLEDSQKEAFLKTAQTAETERKLQPVQILHCELRSKEGRPVPMEGVVQYERARWVALLQHVGWRKELEEAAARLEAVGSRGNQAMLIVDETPAVVSVNEAFCRLFNLTGGPDKWQGVPLAALGDSDTSPLRNAGFLLNPPPSPFQMKIPGGPVIQVEVLEVTAPHAVGRVFLLRESLPGLKAEDPWRPLHAWFRSVLPEDPAFGVAILGPESRFLAVSPKVSAFFGYSPEEMLEFTETQLNAAAGGKPAKATNGSAAALRSYKRKDGTTAAARVQFTQVCNAQGEVAQTLMYLDATAQTTLKAAVWAPKNAETQWAPAAIAPHLPWLKDFNYENDYSRKDVARLTGWQLAGATRRGRLHAHHGTHREDAFRWESRPGYTIVCVSDGAGSSKYSRIGSEVTCREVSRVLLEKFEAQQAQLAAGDTAALTAIVADAMSKSVWQASVTLHDLASATQSELRDFRCTFLLVVHCQSTAGAIMLGSQVGDGFIMGQMKDGKTRRFGTPDSGEYSGQVTCFLPENDAVAKASVIFRIPHDEVEAVLLCSDGLEDPFFPIEKRAETVFRQFYLGVETPEPDFDEQKTHGPILGKTPDLNALEAWLDFEKRGENDDRTAVVLYRHPPTFNPHAPVLL